MTNNLSRKKAHKSSMLRNLATSLILYERIQTTKAKAAQVKAIVEHLIQIAKRNDLNAKRKLDGYLFDKKASRKVFEILLPRYKDKNFGMIKSYQISRRLGDGAEQVIISLEQAKVSLESENGKENAKKQEIGKNSITSDEPKARKTNAKPRKTAKKDK